MRMSLRVKLILIIVGGSFAPMLMNLIVTTSVYKDIMRQDSANQISLIARMAAEDCVSDLASGDKAAAERSLRKFSLVPEVEDAQIYDDQGRVFATYWSEGKSLGLYAKGGTALPLYPDRIAQPQAASVTLRQGRWEILQPIATKERSSGTLRLVASAAVPEALLSARLRVLTVIFLALLLLTVFLAWIIQAHVSRPILRLAGLMQEVSRTYDYSSRITLGRTDEIGDLAKGLNGLLESLQAQRLLRDQAEEKLRLASVYNRALLEASLDFLVTIAADGKITDVNTATEQVTGVARGELIGTDFSDYFTEPEKARAGYQKAFQDGWVRDYELEIRHRDGRVTPVLYNATVYKDAAGTARGVFAVARDITEYKRAEMKMQALNQRLVAANKELESFSYSVAHDLRSPLRAIDGFSQALLEDYSASLDAQGREYLGRAREGVQRMAQMIDDLLKLARVSHAPMAFQDVDLSAMAEDTAAELRRSQPGREVESLLVPGLVAAGDPVLLRSVMRNLLENAWKFTAKKPRARIEFGAAEVDGRKAFFVRDDGAGFDMAYAARLFGTFQRLHTATEFPGTGIGLATVRRIIQRHGGRVWAEGAVGQGATFYFTLPAYTTADIAGLE